MTSDRYQWKDNSIVKEMVIAKDIMTGNKTATIFAPDELLESAGKEPKSLEAQFTDEVEKRRKLASLQEDLLQFHGLYSYPQTVDGKPALVVHRFDKDEQVTKALDWLKVTNGAPEKTTVKDPDEKPLTLGQNWDLFRHKYALKVSGVSGLVGHSLMATSGFIEKDPSKFAIAGIYAVNCLIFACYGNGDKGLQADPALQKMRGFLSENGIDLDKMPMEEVVAHYEKSKSFSQKLDAFVSKNSIVLGEGIAAANNVLMIQSGLERKEQGVGIAMAGAFTLLGSLWAMLVKEVPMKDQPKEVLENPFSHAVALMQANPMTVNAATNAAGLLSLFKDPYERFKLIKNSDLTYKDSSGNLVKTTYHAKAEADLVDTRRKLSEAVGETANVNINTTDVKKPVSNGGVDLAESSRTIKNLTKDEHAQKLNYDLIAKGDLVWQVPIVMNMFYLMATFCNAISSKNAAENKDPTIQYGELLARSAQLAVTVPQGKDRDQIISLMGSGLASNPDVKNIQASDIADHIRQMAKDFEKSPFVAQAAAKAVVVEDIPTKESTDLGFAAEVAKRNNTLKPTTMEAHFADEIAKRSQPSTTITSADHHNARVQDAPLMAVIH
jgi:hypothetical protein